MQHRIQADLDVSSSLKSKAALDQVMRLPPGTLAPWPHVTYSPPQPRQQFLAGGRK